MTDLTDKIKVILPIYPDFKKRNRLQSTYSDAIHRQLRLEYPDHVFVPFTTKDDWRCLIPLLREDEGKWFSKVQSHPRGFALAELSDVFNVDDTDKLLDAPQFNALLETAMFYRNLFDETRSMFSQMGGMVNGYRGRLNAINSGYQPRLDLELGRIEHVLFDVKANSTPEIGRAHV